MAHFGVLCGYCLLMKLQINQFCFNCWRINLLRVEANKRNHQRSSCGGRLEDANKLIFLFTWGLRRRWTIINCSFVLFSVIDCKWCQLRCNVRCDHQLAQGERASTLELWVFTRSAFDLVLRKLQKDSFFF